MFEYLYFGVLSSADIGNLCLEKAGVFTKSFTELEEIQLSSELKTL